jgi:cell wall assembly regulator SMI1
MRHGGYGSSITSSCRFLEGQERRQRAVWGTPMESLPIRIRNYWLAHGMKIRPGASVEDLDAFEHLHGVRLPPDVRAFLQAVNGFEEGEWDEEMVEWYPISKWEPFTNHYSIARTLPDATSYYLFADYCLHGFDYAMHLGPGPNDQNTVILWFGGNPPWLPLASSFSELLEAYLRDPAVMLG